MDDVDDVAGLDAAGDVDDLDLAGDVADLEAAGVVRAGELCALADGQRAQREYRDGQKRNG